jgi:uncharacterized protein YdcH (DUF465 family)
LVHKSNLLNWLKTKIDGISREDESDHVHVECSLIRCISEYREKELSQIKIDKDFNTRLLNRLEHIDLEVVETYSDGTERKYSLPFIFSGGFALVAVIVSVVVFYSGESSNPEFGKFPAHVTPIHLNDNTYSRISAEQESLLNELKKNPENVRLLEKLETYYSENGKKEQATEIHFMLETVSKKY